MNTCFLFLLSPNLPSKDRKRKVINPQGNKNKRGKQTEDEITFSGSWQPMAECNQPRKKVKPEYQQRGTSEKQAYPTTERWGLRDQKCPTSTLQTPTLPFLCPYSSRWERKGHTSLQDLPVSLPIHFPENCQTGEFAPSKANWWILRDENDGFSAC